LATPGIECAQTPVRVGLERAHAECVGQGEGLLVVGSGRVGVQGSAMRGDLTEEVQGICLVAAFLVRAGECQGLLGERVYS
jgi:hypothetical protein